MRESLKGAWFAWLGCADEYTRSMHAGGATESRVAGAHLHAPVRPIGRPAILTGVAIRTGAVFIAIGVALLMIGDGTWREMRRWEL